jgi:hypothetical protein
MLLTPAVLRSVRKEARLVAFGVVRYCFSGAMQTTDGTFLKPPRYSWRFVAQEGNLESEDSHEAAYGLDESLSHLLLQLTRHGGTAHLEGWGLFRALGLGHSAEIELLPDPGFLLDDHPHYGWAAVSLRVKPVQPAAKAARTKTLFAKSLRGLGLFLVLLATVCGRWLLVGDGSEPFAAEQLHHAGMGPVFYPKLTTVNQADHASEVLPQPIDCEFPMEDHRFVRTAHSNSPATKVIVGMYRMDSMAFAKTTSARLLGFEVVVFQREVVGMGQLYAVSLPYRGDDSRLFLQKVRQTFEPKAWILEDQAS